jgi:nucleoside-diphosphate-sugar epimerase
MIRRMAKVLILGGSGFLSGTMAREAVGEGHEVWVVTRGQRPLPQGVRAIVADRKERENFKSQISNLKLRWDLVIDSIGYNADDARQDLECFTGRSGQLVFISTDFVLSPINRPWKVDETYDRFNDTPYGTGKRAAEEVLLGASSELAVTVLRPCHIYGPGSLLGCLPKHGRDKDLIERIRRRETLTLVGGGFFLQQPVFAADLWRMAISCLGNSKTHGQIYCAPGPETVESRVFYWIIGEVLGVEVKIGEVAVTDYLREHPEHASFCAHRVYSLDKAKSHGLTLPSTPLREGLGRHVTSMLA